jgi:hypothetical protein
MSTQYYTDDRPATSQPDTSHRAPRPSSQGPSWYRIWAIVIGTIIAAALIILAAVGLTHNHATTSRLRHELGPGQPGAADHSGLPGRHPVGVGEEAAAGTGPAELLRGPR